MTLDAPRRLVVVEANEIPLRVFREHTRREPASAIARLLDEGRVVETEVRESLDRRLYPSQTWYSMNSGVPFSDHAVFWYGDPKPAEHPLYWQLAARAGRRVGIVNTLHSSPLAQQCAEGNYAFVIPDSFAESDDAFPNRYRAFQSLNLELTRASGRTANVKPRVGHLKVAASLPALGVRPGTIVGLARLAGGIATKRTNKERLRGAQAMLLSDMFFKLCRSHDPDLAVFFTNHVASAMHRYWYALFPGDWDSPLYDREWVKRFEDEIPAAMRTLDQTLGQLSDWCIATGRTLVVLTSMGQTSAGVLDTSVRSTIVVRDPRRFAEVLGLGNTFNVGSAMVPQIHYEFADSDIAAEEQGRLQRIELGEGRLSIDRNGNVLTVSYHLGDASCLHVDGKEVSLEAAGAVRERIYDHRSGEHDPRGAMLVANSALAGGLPDVIDALDVAPLLLGSLGVEPARGMRSMTHAL